MAKRQGKSNRKSPPGRLRIVAGIWRSRVLEIADVPGLRPTAERIRETLFNWLAPHISGARCLDLFAGTGVLGFEALSRGAREAVLVEPSSRAAALLRRNSEALGANGASILEGTADDFMAAAHDAFDIVFLDPPFDADALAGTCESLHESGLVRPGGFVYLEDDRSRSLPPLPPGWTVHRERTAGNVRYALVSVDAE